MDASLDFLRGKMVVIFGCGYIGVALARAVRAAGAEVWGVTRNPDRVAELKASGIHGVEAELSSGQWRVRVPDRAEFAINCVSASSGDAAGYRQSYIEGNKAIATWAYNGWCGHFLYTSSTGVYAQGKGLEVDESAPLHGGTERTFLLRAAEDAALRVRCDVTTIARLAGIYGPARHHFLDTVLSGAPIPGSPDDYMNLIHRDDVVSALLALMDVACGGVLNVSDGAPAPRGEVAAWIANRAARPAPVFDGSAGRGTPSRRIIARRITTRTGWRPRFPSFREGFAALMDPTER